LNVLLSYKHEHDRVKEKNEKKRVKEEKSEENTQPQNAV
jgi:hypothetical protein